jgi:hypothetical protein
LPERWRAPAVALILAALLHGILLWPTPLVLQAAATLVLTGLLPGALLVTLLVGRSKAPPTLGERAVYSIGAGYSCIVALLLLLSYLPGGLTRGQTLVAFDGLIVVLSVLLVIHKPAPQSPEPGANLQNRWLVFGLLTLALIGGFFRFVNLGYSEFQGDEARLALYAAELIQGYDNPLFVHKKGPTETLLPTVIYALSDRLTETTARLPFALANFTALFAAFLLGRRLFGPVAGWVGAILLALDGYLIAFGRVVQYQSIVFLMDVLVVLVFVRLMQQPVALTRYMTLAAILLATGLLSHYEAALVCFPVLYLLWRIWRQGTPLAQLLRALWVPVAVGGALLAAFYLPYVRNPAFLNTYYYLTDYRMGGGSIFNHLAEFFARATVYSSTYYLLTLIGLAVVGLAGIYWRGGRGPLRWLLIGALLTGMALTFWSPTWLKLGETDWLWLFFATALLAAWLMPGFAPADRTIWLWFGAPMILALFFTAIPNTHVYSFFIPWGLLGGRVISHGWDWLRTRLSLRAARAIALPVAASVILVFGLYEYWLFVYNRVEVLRMWPEQRPSGYWVGYEMPVEVAIFGFPNHNGWKTVASLYANGTLQGNYDTNARDVIAEWYTRGDHYCATNDLRYFMLTYPVEPSLADEYAVLRNDVENQHKLWGEVTIHGQPKLRIYERTEQPLSPQQFASEEFSAEFDRALAGPHFERTGPVSPAWISNPINYRFGESIWLKGYRLQQSSVAPGAVLEVTLYWQGTQPISQDYNVFVQLIDLSDLAKAGQSDNQPGCNRAESSTWLPGDTISDRHRVQVDPNARLGTYTVLVGIYLGEQRLDVFNSDGQPLGNGLELTQVEVTP